MKTTYKQEIEEWLYIIVALIIGGTISYTIPVFLPIALIVAFVWYSLGYAHIMSEIASKIVDTVQNTTPSMIKPQKLDKLISEETQTMLFRMKKQEYLKSPEWNTKRKQALANANYECESCGAKTALAVHHLRGYNQIPNEPQSALVALCATCHDKQHEKYGYPQTYKEYMSWNKPLI